ncbi:MAG: amidase family protein, partial [Defluviitaleaceae bacterium]|nr:amidase family protein [Defluviitaleaceae bacterium]
MTDITYASIRELHEAYREGKLTVNEVVVAHLSRIADIDSCEGGLKSVIEINPDALFTAKALDRKLYETKEMPPLYGIPILIKDNIGTYELRTSAGALALADNYTIEAPIVRSLTDAGAVILGKANMTELANYMTRDGMPNGYSSRGGQTLCPYNHEKDPSGSSTGSAVAVAAGLCVASLGTETSGSIISPAGVNGVVGIKPTIGLVSRNGVIPISGTFDTAGPMARNVTDAAIMLGIIADNGRDYTKHLTGENLSGIRIGLNRAKELANIQEGDEKIAAFDRLCELLENAGAILIDNLEMQPRYDTRMTIMHYEFKACMNSYLSRRSFRAQKIQSLKDIIDFNQANAATALKYGQSLLLDAQNKASGNMTEPAYLEALIEREKAITEMECLFDKHNLDVLLGNTFAYIAPFTGFPSMTIPIGQR